MVFLGKSKVNHSYTDGRHYQILWRLDQTVLSLCLTLVLTQWGQSWGQVRRLHRHDPGSRCRPHAARAQVPGPRQPVSEGGLELHQLWHNWNNIISCWLHLSFVLWMPFWNNIRKEITYGIFHMFYGFFSCDSDLTTSCKSVCPFVSWSVSDRNPKTSRNHSWMNIKSH